MIKLPDHIVRKLLKWMVLVNDKGIEEIRKIHGYHDKPLSRDRQGQRSIRLSISYRAFYVEYEEELNSEIIDIIEIIEVNKHDY